MSTAIGKPKLELFNKILENENRINALEQGGGGTGGSTEAIIDVVALPTENINEQVLYRAHTATTYFYHEKGTLQGLPVSVIIVNELPEDGVFFTDDKSYTCYFSLNEVKLYGYGGEDTLTMFGAKWIEIHTLMNYIEYQGREVISWGGVISSIEDATNELAVYVMFDGVPVLYHYKDGWHKICEGESNGDSSGDTDSEVLKLGDFVIDGANGEIVNESVTIRSNVGGADISVLDDGYITLNTPSPIEMYGSYINLYSKYTDGDTSARIALNGEDNEIHINGAEINLNGRIRVDGVEIEQFIANCLPIYNGEAADE